MATEMTVISTTATAIGTEERERQSREYPDSVQHTTTLVVTHGSAAIKLPALRLVKRPFSTWWPAL